MVVLLLLLLMSMLLLLLELSLAGLGRRAESRCGLWLMLLRFPDSGPSGGQSTEEEK